LLFVENRFIQKKDSGPALLWLLGGVKYGHRHSL
jgi:hypothetical protein